MVLALVAVDALFLMMVESVGGEGEVICEDCFEEYASQCQCCGEWFYTDDMVWDRDIEGYVCRFCWEDRD